MGIVGGIMNVLGLGRRRSDAAELLVGVRQAYSDAALDPSQSLPFPVGRAFAEGVGYPKAILDSLPAEAVSSFAGVGPLGEFAEIDPGATVLDLGCGAGLDSLLAARKCGASGRVLGIDFSQAMLAKARVASRLAGVSNILHCSADAGRLPLTTASVDVVLVNGIFNLNPGRWGLFQEMARVLKPGGVTFAAELVFTRPQKIKEARDIKEWLA